MNRNDPEDPSARSIPRLVAEVYESAPPPLRARLVEQMLRPFGVLSLVVIADGVFARMRFRGGWPNFRVRAEDLESVGASHVRALASHAEQVGAEIVDGLAQLIAASPLLAGSAAAALLVSLLVRRMRRLAVHPQASDSGVDDAA
jgi:hypothetical protein